MTSHALAGMLQQGPNFSQLTPRAAIRSTDLDRTSSHEVTAGVETSMEQRPAATPYSHFRWAVPSLFLPLPFVAGCFDPLQPSRQVAKHGTPTDMPQHVTAVAIHILVPCDARALAGP